MKKTIKGKEYYIPGRLTAEQEAIYCHIIDWKQTNITAERGTYNGNEYDAVLPADTAIPAMIYKPLVRPLEEMQQGAFAYKPHDFAHHAVSSQTACINLFMPLLLSDEANGILRTFPGAPSDFGEIARERLFRGFCFEYWGQDIQRGKGLLNDHSALAGTDADVAIAYYNREGALCLWLIEHKLAEKEFTECGAFFRSRANTQKENCRECSLTTIADDPQKCHYHAIGYRYWELLIRNKGSYQGPTDIKGCPFRGGLNQLWRNQMLAFALEETKVYRHVTFSVCHHARNTMLTPSITRYQTLTSQNPMFSSFTNRDLLTAIAPLSSDLHPWKHWYEEVYCF